MLQGEHSAILSTFIKLPVSIKTFDVLSIFKWQLKIGSTVLLYAFVIKSYFFRFKDLHDVGADGN